MTKHNMFKFIFRAKHVSYIVLNNIKLINDLKLTIIKIRITRVFSRSFKVFNIGFSLHRNFFFFKQCTAAGYSFKHFAQSRADYIAFLDTAPC